MLSDLLMQTCQYQSYNG